MSITKGRESFRQLQNQYLDNLSSIDRLIKSSVGNLNEEKLKKLNQDFKEAQDLIKEMELETLSIKQNQTEAKQEKTNSYPIYNKIKIQMHSMDLKDLKKRFKEMIKTNQKYTSSQMQGLEQYIVDMDEINGYEDFNTDQNFFSGNVKLIQGKQDILFVEQLAMQTEKNIFEQNQQLDKMNQNQKHISIEIQDSDKSIKMIQAKKQFTKYIIYFMLIFIAILFFYIISDKIIYIFS